MTQGGRQSAGLGDQPGGAAPRGRLVGPAGSPEPACPAAAPHRSTQPAATEGTSPVPRGRSPPPSRPAVPPPAPTTSSRTHRSRRPIGPSPPAGSARPYQGRRAPQRRVPADLGRADHVPRARGARRPPPAGPRRDGPRGRGRGPDARPHRRGRRLRQLRQPRRAAPHFAGGSPSVRAAARRPASRGPPAAPRSTGRPGPGSGSAARRAARTAEPVERRRELPLDHRPFTGPEHHLPQPVPPATSARAAHTAPPPAAAGPAPRRPTRSRRRSGALPGGHGLGGPYACGVAPDAQQRLGEVRRRGTGAQPLVLPQSLDQPVRVHAPWSRVGVASRNGRGRVGTACAASRTRACGTALRASWTQPRPLRSWCRTESAGTRPRTAAAVRSGPRSRPAGDGTRAVPQPPPAGERRLVVPRPLPRGSGTPAGRAVESALEVPRRPGVGVGQRRDRLHRLRRGVRRGLQNAGGGHRGQDLFVGRVHRCGRIQLLAEHLGRVCPVHGTQQVCGPRRFPPRILGSPVTAPPRTGRAGHPFQRPLRNRGVLVAERLRHRQQFGRPVRITSQSLSEQYQSGPAELLLGTEGHRCRHLRELSGRQVAGGGEPGQDLLHMARRGRGPSAAVAIQSGNPAPVPAVPPGRPRGSRAPGPAARPGPWTAPRRVAERWSAGACPPGGGPPIHARQRLPSRMTRATRAGSSFIGT